MGSNNQARTPSEYEKRLRAIHTKGLAIELATPIFVRLYKVDCLCLPMPCKIEFENERKCQEQVHDVEWQHGGESLQCHHLQVLLVYMI